MIAKSTTLPLVALECDLKLEMYGDEYTALYISCMSGPSKSSLI